jgi:hypothetical protein
MVFKALFSPEFKCFHTFWQIVEQGRPVTGLVAKVRIKPLTGSAVGALLFLNALIDEPGAQGRQLLLPGGLAGGVQPGLLVIRKGWRCRQYGERHDGGAYSVFEKIGFAHIHSFRGGAEALILHQRAPTRIRVDFLSEY